MPSPAKVVLTREELELADAVGVRRQIRSVEAGRKEQHGCKPGDEALRVHILGTQGEMAVAKLLNLYWGGHVDIFHAPDLVSALGSPIQVRTR